VAAELTAIERRVLARVLALVTGAFGEAWSGVLPLSPELLRVECDPRLAAIGAPSDLTLVCRFDLAGVVRGPLHVLIPYAVIEPVRKALSAPPRALGDVDARATAALARGLARAEVAVHAEVGRAKLSFSQVLGLKVGDVVTLDQREDAPVPVYVQGRRKMTAWPRVLGGQVGLVIERGVEKR
jgi:flagellar motor switch protein FliM